MSYHTYLTKLSLFWLLVPSRITSGTNPFWHGKRKKMPNKLYSASSFWRHDNNKRLRQWELMCYQTLITSCSLIFELAQVLLYLLTCAYDVANLLVLIHIISCFSLSLRVILVSTDFLGDFYSNFLHFQQLVQHFWLPTKMTVTTMTFRWIRTSCDVWHLNWLK